MCARKDDMWILEDNNDSIQQNFLDTSHIEKLFLYHQKIDNNDHRNLIDYINMHH